MGEDAADAIECGVAVQPGGQFEVGVQFVQMPAQPVDHAGALGDEVLAVVDQQSHVTAGSIEVCGRQVRVSQRRTGDRERVDRV